MGAIFGIINKNRAFLEPNQIEKAKIALAHRSTEGAKTWQEGGVYLWNAKQQFYPQQQGEVLPFEKKNLVMVADAVLFNRTTLFYQLGITENLEDNISDSYLILAAFQKWGKDCVNYLDGEYVFAIWDKLNKELFLASDHIGFRPVFYYDSPSQFIFCSEIKGIVAAKLTPNYFNNEHLIEYHFRKSPANQTFNKEIFALCGGNILQLTNNQISIKKYWSPKPKGKYHFNTAEDWAACLKELMFKAVEKRFNPDFPIGVTLSGGLDSSSIACILSELLQKHNKPLYAFSSVLPLGHQGIEEDERKYIEIVNKHCPNIIQTYVEAPDGGPFQKVEQAFQVDEQIPNGFFYMDQAILEKAQQMNIRTLYSGFGGDFWATWNAQSVLYELISEKDYKAVFKLIKSFLKHDKNLLRVLRIECFSSTALYGKLKSLILFQRVDWQKKTALNLSFVQQFDYLDFNNYSYTTHLDEMLRFIELGQIARIEAGFANRNAAFNISAYADIMFDKDILEFLMDLPVQHFRMGGWKRGLIRHAMEGILPKEIQWRKDKLPYNPDYSNRIIKGLPILNQLLHNEGYDFVFEQFFDRDFIEKYLHIIKPHKGMGTSNSVGGIRIAQAGISAIVLKHLKDQGYLFN